MSSERFPLVAAVDWSRADDLPDGVAPRWRDGESLRRAAEERAAGRARTILRGFLAPAFASVLVREAAALPGRARAGTEGGSFAPARLGLPALREIVEDATTRELFGALLGRTLGRRLRLSAWLFEAGEGRRWQLPAEAPGPCFAIGLNPGWTAAQGGALAFGRPGPDGRLQVEERWLPHQGDLCLYLPQPGGAQEVEAPVRSRWTVCGAWED